MTELNDGYSERNQAVDAQTLQSSREIGDAVPVESGVVGVSASVTVVFKIGD